MSKKISPTQLVEILKGNHEESGLSEYFQNIKSQDSETILFSGIEIGETMHLIEEFECNLDIAFMNCEFKSSVKFYKVLFNKRVTFYECIFNETVKVKGGVFSNLSFSKCMFTEELNIIGGEFSK